MLKQLWELTKQLLTISQDVQALKSRLRFERQLPPGNASGSGFLEQKNED
jgi:hypothetical protein